MSNQKRPLTTTLALDPGNYEVKFRWGHQQQLLAIRSDYYTLRTGQVSQGQTAVSPVITHEGMSRHFGVASYRYRSQEATVQQAKEDLVLWHFYATLASLEASEVVIERLAVSHPDPDAVASRYRELLTGTHEVVVNGVSYRVSVQSTLVVQEGLAAWHQMANAGFTYDEGYSVVIDIGGGTAIALVVDEVGGIVDRMVSQKGGAYELAAAIASDSRLQASLGDIPKPNRVLSGLVKGYYGSRPETSWEAWVSEYVDPWFRGIFQTVKSQFHPYMADVRTILVTGGSSHLFSSKLAGNPLFQLADNPRFANVAGLSLLASGGANG